MDPSLEKKLKDLPRSAGVYFHKASDGEIIYIGKAAVLKNRVRQYFQKSRDLDVKTQALVAEIADTDWLETDSELDALFLESEMVKRYMPRYNVLLRDDKSQTFIRIDMKSDWPVVSFTRNPLDDGAEYFGPYYNGFVIKKALRYLRRVFPYYTKAPRSGERPSLDTHIGLSPSPETSIEEYKASLRQLIGYIKGNRKAIIRDIEDAMNQAAKESRFEEAAVLRNKLLDIKSLQQKIMFGDREFLDISKDKALSDLKSLLGLKKEPARIEGYDISHIGGTNVVASMVVFTNGVSDRANYRKFKMRSDKNDDYANMREVLLRRFSEKNLKSWGRPDLILIDGGKGHLAVAIEALAERGVKVPVIGVAKREEEIIIHKDKSQLGELATVRSENLEGASISRSGDFLVVNLHPGQLKASGHAKNLRTSATGRIFRYEHVVKLIQRVRDESHRFAISYHSLLRTKSQTKNKLEEIPGVGAVTRKKLLKKFGSVKGVEEASIEDLKELVGAKAGAIKAYLSNK